VDENTAGGEAAVNGADGTDDAAAQVRRAKADPAFMAVVSGIVERDRLLIERLADR
jgi:hypothetical protein